MERMLSKSAGGPGAAKSVLLEIYGPKPIYENRLKGHNEESYVPVVNSIRNMHIKTAMGDFKDDTNMVSGFMQRHNVVVVTENKTQYKPTVWLNEK